MNNSTLRRPSGTVRLLLMVTLALALVFGTGQTARAISSGPAPVNLGTAAFFAVLSKTGITNVPTSSVTGDMGVSPIAASAITGFSLVKDSSGTFATSTQVTGKVYAANYTSPTPAKMTTAIGDMQTAYVDAAGRSLPDFTELYAGDISGQTLTPGLYKWGTDVVINTDVTLSGSSSAHWIFQISGNLIQASGTHVLLSGGADPKNIFWQVGGGVGVNIGTTAHMEGTILALKAIHLLTGASSNGRLLSQTAVTLQQNTIVSPTTTSTIPPTTSMIFRSDGALDGTVLESATGSGVGGSVNANGNFLLGDDSGDRQYRAILSFDTSGLPDTAVVTKVAIRIVKQSAVNNPFLTLGKVTLDIGNPYFDGGQALEVTDFEAVSSLDNVGLISSGHLNVQLSNTAAFPFVNLVGLTQLRLRFQTATNSNGIANQLAFYSGDAPGILHRPSLTVSFFVP